MKKSLFLVLCFISTLIFAQTGTILTDVSKSDILKKDMSYSVYLPPSYEKSQRAYPILYLLHGMTGDNTDWVNRGEVARIAAQAMQSGKAPEMIIVMPDGLFDAFYINNYDKSVQWEDYFYKELIPSVEKKYRTFSQRQYRAIAGLSMGGYGSLYHALKHKDMFSGCYTMSGAFLEIEPLKAGEKPGQFENVYVKLWGARNATGLHENFKAHSLAGMVKDMEEYKVPQGWGQPSLPAIVIDCGDDDFLLKANTNMVHLMKEKKIPLEFRVRDGGHTWEYWRTGLDLALEFVGKLFRG
jgi:S-formylglutathione hydrolase FrmB